MLTIIKETVGCFPIANTPIVLFMSYSRYPPLCHMIDICYKPLLQRPQTFWAPGTGSEERSFSWTGGGVVLYAACIPWMGLHLFEQSGFWHAMGGAGPQSEVGDPCSIGDTGQGVRDWIKQVLKQDLSFQHIKVIYPTAPARPYTPMRGSLSNVWFDRYKISNDCPEHTETIDMMCQALNSLIDDEVKNGIRKNRILLGGFSMGGGMALHLAYRHHQEVAGVFALSSFLNKNSAVYQALEKNERELPELFQCHGTADELVLYSWGEETNKTLKALGVTTTFFSLPNFYHELNKSELEKLRSWILKKLPEEP